MFSRLGPQLAVVSLLLLVPALPAQSELQQVLKDTDLAPHWIYDDLPRAMAQAKATAKPLLVVLRCVPCPPGRTLDQQVNRPDGELEKLEQQFVCVRIVQTNGLDLKLFQYDYDQSWCAMFLNADGTIYGRYGTRSSSGPKSDSYLTRSSFEKALARVLELHRHYPANREQLAAKALSTEPEWRSPVQIPGLIDRPRSATSRQTCIHCHMVREFQLRAKWEQGRLTAADLHVYPLPQNIGLTMDLQDGLRVESVLAGSPADKAGLADGDELLTLGGQPLVSLADIQWVLHIAPAETSLPVTFRRKGQTLQKTITLSGNWKESDLAWRASSWYGLRHGLQTQPLAPADKQKRGIAADRLALVVKGLFGKGAGPLQKAGLRVGDVIVAVDGKSADRTESQFLIDLRLNHGPRDKVTFTVLRGQERHELVVPMW